ncbi:MAG: TetR/AcrR family transcriptional regulator [bacterium]|nr:TetR/AcrR family transcriptional regulator [bacterium]
MTDPTQQALIAARRDQILDAAAVVFAAKGFHQTTIRDIARHAGIADGTIYNYFESKPALLMGIFQRMRDVILREAESLTSAPPAALPDVRTFMRAFLVPPLMALKRDNFGLFRIVLAEMMVNDELRALYQREILQPALGVGEAYLRAYAAGRGLDPEAAALTLRAISGMILGLMLHHIIGDPVVEEAYDRLPDVLADLVISGIEGQARVG